MHLRRHRAKAKHVYACILRMIERAHGDADSRSSSMQKKKKSVPALTAVHCMQGEAGGVAFAYGSEQERRGEERDGRVTTGGEEGKRDAGWPRCRGRCAISFLYLLPPLPYNKARGASLYIACFACPDHICIPCNRQPFFRETCSPRLSVSTRLSSSSSSSFLARSICIVCLSWWGVSGLSVHPLKWSLGSIYLCLTFSFLPPAGLTGPRDRSLAPSYLVNVQQAGNSFRRVVCLYTRARPVFSLPPASAAAAAASSSDLSSQSLLLPLPACTVVTSPLRPIQRIPLLPLAVRLSRLPSLRPVPRLQASR
jgi:hypothetical protein